MHTALTHQHSTVSHSASARLPNTRGATSLYRSTYGERHNRLVEDLLQFRQIGRVESSNLAVRELGAEAAGSASNLRGDVAQ